MGSLKEAGKATGTVGPLPSLSSMQFLDWPQDGPQRSHFH